MSWKNSSLFLKILVIAYCFCNPAPVYADGGGNSKTFGDCTIQIPPGAKVQPQQPWYDKFKEAFGQNGGDGAKDKNDWKAKERPSFDTCAAFKLLMGICWKESGLNPSAGAGADAIPSPGMCQIQQRNCDGVGVAGNLNDPVVTVECAAKIMKKNIESDHCITAGADQAGNGKCLTNWSVMISSDSNKVGHREEIKNYQTGTGNPN